MNKQNTVALFGAGAMGRAIAWDLRRWEPKYQLLVFDRSPEALQSLTALVGAESVECHVQDASEKDAVGLALAQSALAIGAAGYHLNLELCHQAVNASAHWIDLGGNNDVVERQFRLNNEAKRAGVAVIPDCGLAPGLVSILAAEAVQRLDVVEELHFRVGGLPQCPKPPLGYQICFSPQGLINEYLEPTRFIEDGEIRAAPSLTGAEEIEFGEPVGRLVAFHTSGGASTMIESFAGRVKALDYKTLRYPGHLEQIKLLSDLGYFSSDSLNVNDGQKLRPRDLTAALLERRLGWMREDLVVMLSWAVGRRSDRSLRVTYRLVDQADPLTGLTAMARTTGFSAAVTARMILEGEITDRGALRQERSIPPVEFLNRLTQRGVKVEISEKWI